MLDPAITPTLGVLLLTFRECFTEAGHNNFGILATGWIVCQGRHSISRIIQAAGGPRLEKHHSSFYRFLSHGRWSADAIGHVLFRLLLRWLPDTITAILDDTLNHKSGPHIFGAGMHFDACRSTYGHGTSTGRMGFFAFGHNWVVLAVWIPLPWNKARGIALPILFRLYQGKKRCPPASYRKRTVLALELVQILAKWIPEGRKVHLVGDAEYACKTVVRNLPENFVFTGRMNMAAAVFAEPTKQEGRGRPRVKGKRLPSPSQLAKSKSPWQRLTVAIYGRKVEIDVKSQLCLWYTVGGTRMLRMIVTRDPRGRIAQRAYFTTDAALSVLDILTYFARRWEIEVSFRNMKQAMGIEDPQNGWWRRPAGGPRPKKKAGPNPRGRKGEKAINHTLALVFASYALVVIWYFKHGNVAADVHWAQLEAPWYTHKRTVSFNDMLAALRRKIWTARLSKNPALKRVIAKIRNVLPHWLMAA